ncbi:MAG: Crp/Fnr family transcriptional regulator [Parvibaculaceae bacterium]|nr:Crp/Fnr family transcriptional regulator [Parvibaculaceae bacterium]
MSGQLDYGLPGLQETLPTTLREALYDAAVSLNYSDGQLIQARGDTDPSLTIVKSGAARLGQIGIDGSYAGMAVMGPDQFFGEFTIFGGLPREFDAFAVGPTVIAKISKTRFDRLLDKHKGIRSYFLAFLAQRLHAALTFVDDLRRLPLNAQVAKTINMMHQADGKSPTVKVTHEELSEILGVTRVSINKALRQLEKSGLIERAYGRIEIPSPAKLDHWVQSQSRPNAAEI